MGKEKTGIYSGVVSCSMTKNLNRLSGKHLKGKLVITLAAGHMLKFTVTIIRRSGHAKRCVVV